MKALRPDALLATEPGPARLEARRHLQFAEFAIPDESEWYRPAPTLLAFITALAAQVPPPDLQRLLLPQSQRDTHCSAGHPLTPQNTVASRSGGRTCRSCHRAWCRMSAARRRGEEINPWALADRLFAELMETSS